MSLDLCKRSSQYPGGLSSGVAYHRSSHAIDAGFSPSFSVLCFSEVMFNGRQSLVKSQAELRERDGYTSGATRPQRQARQRRGPSRTPVTRGSPALSMHARASVAGIGPPRVSQSRGVLLPANGPSAASDVERNTGFILPIRAGRRSRRSTGSSRRRGPSWHHLAQQSAGACCPSLVRHRCQRLIRMVNPSWVK